MKKVICIDGSYDMEYIKKWGYVVPLVFCETYFVRGEIRLRRGLGYYLDGIFNRDARGQGVEIPYNTNRFIECSDIDELELKEVAHEQP